MWLTGVELMARGPKAEEHPNQISSMLFYLATIIIHGEIAPVLGLDLRGECI